MSPSLEVLLSNINPSSQSTVECMTSADLRRICMAVGIWYRGFAVLEIKGALQPLYDNYFSRTNNEPEAINILQTPF